MVIGGFSRGQVKIVTSGGITKKQQSHTSAAVETVSDARAKKQNEKNREDIVVFITRSEGKCAECGKEFGHGNAVRRVRKIHGEWTREQEEVRSRKPLYLSV